MFRHDNIAEDPRLEPSPRLLKSKKERLFHVHLRQQGKTVITTECNEMRLTGTREPFETFRHDVSLLSERIAENSVCARIVLSHPCAREKAQGQGTEVSWHSLFPVLVPPWIWQRTTEAQTAKSRTSEQEQTPCPILSASFCGKGGKPLNTNQLQTQRAGIPAAFSFAILPFGPTTNGSDNAFQLPFSSGRHVFPSSRLMSEPLLPTATQTRSASDHSTAER